VHFSQRYLLFIPANFFNFRIRLPVQHNQPFSATFLAEIYKSCSMNRIPASFPTLMTERLELRKLSEEDKYEIYGLRTDERVNLYLDREKPENIQGAIDFIRNINKGIEKGDSLYWAICFKMNLRLIGTICLWNFSEKEQSAEIGFELSSQVHGMGLMKEAIPAVIQYAFKQLPLARLDAFTRKANARSMQLLEKNNFVFQSETLDENNQINRIYSLRNDEHYPAGHDD
jgi:[ribosomal protein S5]-alanine N-acetyltransferase